MHHIKPEAEGGSDGAENGIPVCFECHGDIGHYNSSHPKGTKYSESELRQHRDRWFERVASTGVSVSIPEHANIDRRVAAEIHAHMTTQGSYDHLRSNSLHEPWPLSVESELWSLNRKMSFPDLQFLDTDLENLRAGFGKLLAQALSDTGRVSKQHPSREDWLFVGGGLAIDNSPHRDEILHAVATADESRSAAAEAYDDLYCLVRQKLGLDLRFNS